MLTPWLCSEAVTPCFVCELEMEAVHSLQGEVTHFVRVCGHTWTSCSDWECFTGCRSCMVCSRRTVAAISGESQCLMEQCSVREMQCHQSRITPAIFRTQSICFPAHFQRNPTSALQTAEITHLSFLQPWLLLWAPVSFLLCVGRAVCLLSGSE